MPGRQTHVGYGRALGVGAAALAAHGESRSNCFVEMIGASDQRTCAAAPTSSLANRTEFLVGAGQVRRPKQSSLQKSESLRGYEIFRFQSTCVYAGG